MLGLLLHVPGVIAEHRLSSTCQTIDLDQAGGLIEWTDGCRDLSLKFPSTETWLGAGANSDSIDLVNVSVAGAATELAFRFQYASGLLVLRNVELLDPDSVVTRIRFENRGDAPIASEPTISLGAGPAAQHPEEWTLANSLYRYAWVLDLDPEGDASPKAVALYTRHVAVKTIFDSAEIAVSLQTDVEDELGSIHLQIPELAAGATAELQITSIYVPTRTTVMASAGMAHLMFQTVWRPLRKVSVAIEWVIARLSVLLGSVGPAIIGFAVLVRLATFPLNRWSERAQARFNSAQQAMKPQIAEAKATLKGGEQSERILALYKEYGISPLSGLKGTASLLVQLPILIAFFGVTTESEMFRFSEFLWITDLSQPDRTIELGISIPVLGSALNVVPLLLGVVGWLSTRIPPRAGNSGLWMNLLFTVLFYPFAAALVLYWLTVNVLQMLEKLISNRPSSVKAP